MAFSFNVREALSLLRYNIFSKDFPSAVALLAILAQKPFQLKGEEGNGKKQIISNLENLFDHSLLEFLKQDPRKENDWKISILFTPIRNISHFQDFLVHKQIEEIETKERIPFHQKITLSTIVELQEGSLLVRIPNELTPLLFELKQFIESLNQEHFPSDSDFLEAIQLIFYSAMLNNRRYINFSDTLLLPYIFGETEKEIELLNQKTETLIEEAYKRDIEKIEGYSKNIDEKLRRETTSERAFYLFSPAIKGVYQLIEQESFHNLELEEQQNTVIYDKEGKAGGAFSLTKINERVFKMSDPYYGYKVRDFVIIEPYHLTIIQNDENSLKINETHAKWLDDLSEEIEEKKRHLYNSPLFENENALFSVNWNKIDPFLLIKKLTEQEEYLLKIKEANLT